jgi:integrase
MPFGRRGLKRPPTEAATLSHNEMRFIELFQIPTVSLKAHALRVIGSYPIRDLSLHLGRMLRDAAKQEKYTTTVDIIRQIALTGCRRGEMIALKWTEADTEARDIDDSQKRTRKMVRWLML